MSNQVIEEGRADGRVPARGYMDRESGGCYGVSRIAGPTGARYREMGFVWMACVFAERERYAEGALGADLVVFAVKKSDAVFAGAELVSGVVDESLGDDAIERAYQGAAKVVMIIGESELGVRLVEGYKERRSAARSEAAEDPGAGEWRRQAELARLRIQGLPEVYDERG